jgi:hypothetical protein
MIEREVKEKFKSWTNFCKKNGHDKTNFHRKLKKNIAKINKWVEPLGLVITFVKNENPT